MERIECVVLKNRETAEKLTVKNATDIEGIRVSAALISDGTRDHLCAPSESRRRFSEFLKSPDFPAVKAVDLHADDPILSESLIHNRWEIESVTVAAQPSDFACDVIFQMNPLLMAVRLQSRVAPGEEYIAVVEGRGQTRALLVGVQDSILALAHVTASGFSATAADTVRGCGIADTLRRGKTYAARDVWDAAAQALVSAYLTSWVKGGVFCSLFNVVGAAQAGDPALEALSG